jgi:hypothetical protein
MNNQTQEDAMNNQTQEDAMNNQTQEDAMNRVSTRGDGVGVRDRIPN